MVPARVIELAIAIRVVHAVMHAPILEAIYLIAIIIVLSALLVVIVAVFSSTLVIFVLEYVSWACMLRLKDMLHAYTQHTTQIRTKADTQPPTHHQRALPGSLRVRA